MSNPVAFGSRPVYSPSFQIAQDSKPEGAQYASASSKAAARMPTVDPVTSPSSSSITLSQQALDSRLGQLGDKTVEAAQRFVGNIAAIWFGDAANGAAVQLDTISVAADTSRSALVESGSNAGVKRDVAALPMNANAAFVGRATIATADGQSFDVEIAIEYAASVGVSYSFANSATNSNAVQQLSKGPDALALTGRQLPAIEFPGSLADLFKLLGRQLTASANSGKDDGNSGEPSLRLLRLVNSAALLAPRPRADSPDATPAERNRAMASYAAPAASGPITTA